MVSRQWIDDHCMSIKFTKNGDRSIDTWSDSRWSNGDEYKSAGMKLIWSRFIDYSFVTTKQKRIPKKSKEDTSGLYKIWDCGRKRWSTFEPIAA